MSAIDAILEEYKTKFTEEELTDEKVEMLNRYYADIQKEAMRRAVLDEGKRMDGRKTNEIRPIWIETDCLPGPHGFLWLSMLASGHFRQRTNDIGGTNPFSTGYQSMLGDVEQLFPFPTDAGESR